MKLKVLLMTGFMISPLLAQTDLKSGLDKANMDLSVRPGDDFFRYADGGWLKANPLTPEFSRFAQFDKLDEENNHRLNTLITELASQPQEQGSLGQKIGSLYNLAMDSVRRNAEGYLPVQPILDEIRSCQSKTALMLLAARLNRIGVPTWFSVYCGADIMDSKNNLVSIHQPHLTLGTRDYYVKDDEATTQIREAYSSYVRQLLEMIGYTASEAEAKMQSVIALETLMAEASKSAVELRDVQGNYHRMSYTELLEQFPGIDWGNTFLQMGYPAVPAVSVDQPETIRAIEKLLKDTDLETLKSFIEFRVINDAANYLDDQFRETSFGFFGKVMRGAEQDRPRWKRAVGVVDAVLGEAVGYMYVEKYFPASSKARMLELVNNLQAALAERIAAQTWMSEETKAQAIDKLNTFYVKIGYPDKWMDYSGLTIDENLSYYENLTRANEFLFDYKIAKNVNKPVDRDEWYMTPQTINAYYNPTTNEICFPAGILQPPFFNPEADDACNYGAIGVVIGHEMTHGFDDQGAQFDKEGNLRNWWTEADGQNFRKRTQVMSDFFDKIEVLPGEHIQGALTLGENIADHGGLNVAFAAFQRAMSKQPLSIKDGFTPEQRFFLSYALVWANNVREAALRQQIKTDPHSPGEWRVNAALPHIDAWYKAFGITKKDKLFVPKKQRVDVW
ncbi:MAG: M13 family metallopeptidase [Prevotellaceae bacterium]|nr:M13 family metallopeptidase [Prevotellaceae bacterium]